MQEVLVVVIAGQQRVLPMERVIQVRIHSDITRIPGTPEWIRGFVDLEGASVEVFDAARRLDCGELQLDARSCLIFVETSDGRAAMLVDSVEGIVSEQDVIPAIDLEVFFHSERVA